MKIHNRIGQNRSSVMINPWPNEWILFGSFHCPGFETQATLLRFGGCKSSPPSPTLKQRRKSLEKATRLVQKLAKDACLVVSFDQGSYHDSFFPVRKETGVQPRHLEPWRFRLHHDIPQCTALLPAASMGVPSTRYPMSAAYEEAGNAEPGACGSAGILSLVVWCEMKGRDVTLSVPETILLSKSNTLH